MRKRPPKLLILTLVLTIGLAGCVVPPTYSGGPATGGYQQTTLLVEIPALLAAGGVFAIIDLLILPFQAIFGGGNFFPLIGTMTQIIDRLLGNEESPAKPRPPPSEADLDPNPEATRPR